MIIYLLGILDFLAALSMILMKFKINFYGSVFAGYLVVKGLVFIRNIASIVDIVCGAIFFYAIFTGNFSIAAYLAVIWLLQKSVLSFIR